ncbi:hypothetical protein SAMN05661096_01567 [Marivirga sericea]|uniref:Uncharacterized protein n=1 Tax=Marivirga sericea TaxID=1028 RepID=A0A1X7JIG0_9BACT|nr:hypothetical protein [Marivirga sericea]SMG27040.1 hypothetical protein SAMN05661096_01567 [Marivirga sericea]
MKRILFVILMLATFSLVAKEDWKAHFKKGDPMVKSINALSFGPEGILFIGDSENAKVFAIDTQDTEAIEGNNADISLEQFDVKVAELLGTTADQISIEDLVVNPISKNIYFAVQHTSNTPILMKIENGVFQFVSLKEVMFSEALLEASIEAEATDRRGRSMRKWAISDLNYSNGKVMVTGLSNKEFGSTFRSISFPFDEKQEMSSLEIYHAAHGQFETNSPVKAFTATTIAGIEYVIAAYTCTPLVIFPSSDLKPNEHVKGRTVAELGNWNTPLDMVVLQNEGSSYLLMANSNRALMKIALDNVKNFSGSLTEPVTQRGGTAGVEFIALPFVNVLQLDKVSDDTFVMLQRKSDGQMQLFTSGSRWL